MSLALLVILLPSEGPIMLTLDDEECMGEAGAGESGSVLS